MIAPPLIGCSGAILMDQAAEVHQPKRANAVVALDPESLIENNLQLLSEGIVTSHELY